MKNLDEIHQQIESLGFRWVDGSYKDGKSRLLIKHKNCPCEPKWLIYKHRKKWGCSNNVLNDNENKKLKNINKIINYAKTIDYVVHNMDSYKNEKSKLLITCNNRHGYTTSASSFANMKKCPYCAGNRNDKVFKQKLLRRGWIYISGKYENKRSFIKARCTTCNKESLKHFNSYIVGNCIHCQHQNITKWDMFSIQAEIEKFNSHITVESLANARGSFLCKLDGYQWTAGIYDMIHKRRSCPKCIGNPPLVREEVLKEMQTEYRVVSAPSILKVDTKIEVMCTKLHVYFTSRHAWKSGNRCPVCSLSSQTSKAEKELVSRLRKHKITIKSNHRPGWLKGRELDLYLPDQGMAIEYNGIYWHSEKFTPREYHLNKLKACQGQGVQLIQIFEDDWLDRKNQVLNYIESRLGINQKVSAKRCKFRPIDSSIAKIFLNKHHIRGFTASSFHFGLYYQEELVQVMSFRKCQEYLLSRHCTKRGLLIVNGTSKLFKHSTRFMGVNFVSTFVDLCYSEEDVYRKLGFKEVSRSKPDYSYVKGKKRLNKRKLKKTERQKYLKIYDCGRIKYEWSQKIKMGGLIPPLLLA